MLANRYTANQLNREFICEAWTGQGETAQTHDDHMNAAQAHLSSARDASNQGKTAVATANNTAAEAHMKAAKAGGDTFQAKSKAARCASKDCNAGSN
jgi:hypothetical protein